MLGARPVIAIIAFTMAVILFGLALLNPAPRRINVRWAERATTADRVHEGALLHLGGAEPRGERTWNYELFDESPANIMAIVAHPLVEDTAGIDRGNATLTPELPGVRASLRQTYRALRVPVESLLWIGTIFGVAGLALAWSSVRRTFTGHPARTVLAGVLVLSLLLRCALVLSGGQLYWPDENRYLDVRGGVAAFAANDRDGVARALDEPEHILFKVIAVLPATVELVRGDDSRIPALFFALFSVVNIWLVVVIARRLDAGRTAALVAGALFALSTSFFYYSRHLLPYDTAATFALLALFVASAPGARWRHSVACGVLAACAFLAYAGYWTLGGAMCVIHVCDVSAVRDGVRRAVLAGAGLAGTLVSVLLIYAVAGSSPIGKLAAFASASNQGTVSEGWRVPWEYLWHAEHGLLVLWLACLLWCALTWRDTQRSRVVRAGVVGVVFTYATLTLFSVVLDQFAVYGRLARQLVPFFCLLTAAVIVRGWQARPEHQRGALALVAALVLAIQATVNFGPPLRQEFPREFLPRAEDAAARAGAGEPTIAYARHLFPGPEPFAMEPGSRVVVQAAHPLQFLPYQYEGFDPAKRDVIRSMDIRMRAVVPPAALPTTAR